SAIVEALEKLDLHFPEVAKDSLDELQKARAALEREGRGAPAVSKRRPRGA
ncbi:MAG TPA: polyphosphate kinase 2 family protein, partial [Pararhizobium sp.]|nr:polyphosphate kinase 2 family protein [Pararhizobium sp.]